MKYAIITLDNSVIQIELSNFQRFSSPAKGYIELVFEAEPDLVSGNPINTYLDLEFNVFRLLIPFAPRMTFTNTSRVAPEDRDEPEELTGE